MSQQKYYAVKNGKKCGIFRTWEECSAQVIGFAGAQYKSFKTEFEALAYLKDTTLLDNSLSAYLDKGYLIAYTDGSYDDTIKKYSYGVAIIKNEDEIIKMSGASNNPDYLSFRNISGEILGALNAMKYAVDNEYQKIVIFHDLEGVCKWATREWKAETLVTKKYEDVVNNYYRPLLHIEFQKVVGHSNNKYNDLVDSIAKDALINGQEADLSILERPRLF